MTRLLSAAAVGTALLLMWRAMTSPAPPRPLHGLRRSRRYAAVRELLDQSGLVTWRVRTLVAACLGAAAVAFCIGFVITGVPALAVVVACVGGWAPAAFVRGLSLIHI